jgi:hypothetical protein
MNVSYMQAKQLCEADGSKLAIAPYGTGDKIAIQPYVLRLAAAVLNSDPVLYGYWMDGTDSVIDGLWQLPDGMPPFSSHWIQSRKWKKTDYLSF